MIIEGHLPSFPTFQCPSWVQIVKAPSSCPPGQWKDRAWPTAEIPGTEVSQRLVHPGKINGWEPENHLEMKREIIFQTFISGFKMLIFRGVSRLTPTYPIAKVGNPFTWPLTNLLGHPGMVVVSRNCVNSTAHSSRVYPTHFTNVAVWNPKPCRHVRVSPSFSTIFEDHSFLEIFLLTLHAQLYFLDLMNFCLILFRIENCWSNSHSKDINWYDIIPHPKENQRHANQGLVQVTLSHTESLTPRFLPSGWLWYLWSQLCCNFWRKTYQKHRQISIICLCHKDSIQWKSSLQLIPSLMVQNLHLVQWFQGTWLAPVAKSLNKTLFNQELQSRWFRVHVELPNCLSADPPEGNEGSIFPRNAAKALFLGLKNLLADLKNCRNPIRLELQLPVEDRSYHSCSCSFWRLVKSTIHVTSCQGHSRPYSPSLILHVLVVVLVDVDLLKLVQFLLNADTWSFREGSFRRNRKWKLPKQLSHECRPPMLNLTFWILKSNPWGFIVLVAHWQQFKTLRAQMWCSLLQNL